MNDCTRPAKCSLNDNKVWAAHGDDFPSTNPSQLPSQPTATSMPSNKISTLPSSGDALVACSSTKCIDITPPDTVTAYVPIGSTNYGIRCCADSNLQGFVQAKANCPNLWVTSKAENGVCVSHTTYSDALAICEGFGARFCTVEENFSDCTRPAKCGLNDRKVWAALSPGTSPI